MIRKIRVAVWNEFWDERLFDHVKKIYPEGIHNAIADSLKEDKSLEVTAVSFEDPDYGLSDHILDQTDVLIWWSHVIPHKVPDDRIEKIYNRVYREGMGFIALHSGMYSKIFGRLVGECMNSAFREDGEKERVWIVNPAHEICNGLGAFFEIEHTEVYREPTGFPLPDELLFISWYAGGEAGISGGCYYRGLGRIFYFTPGHEDYPVYYNENVRRIINNGVHWAYNPGCVQYERGEVAALEALDDSELLHYLKNR